MASEKLTEDLDIDPILFAEFFIKLHADCFNGILALEYFVVRLHQSLFEIKGLDLELFLRQALACMALFKLLLRFFMLS